jgi:hypothetical protein
LLQALYKLSIRLAADVPPGKKGQIGREPCRAGPKPEIIARPSHIGGQESPLASTRLPATELSFRARGAPRKGRQVAERVRQRCFPHRAKLSAKEMMKKPFISLAEIKVLR